MAVVRYIKETESRGVGGGVHGDGGGVRVYRGRGMRGEQLRCGGERDRGGVERGWCAV